MNLIKMQERKLFLVSLRSSRSETGERREEERDGEGKERDKYSEIINMDFRFVDLFDSDQQSRSAQYFGINLFNDIYTDVGMITFIRFCEYKYQDSLYQIECLFILQLYVRLLKVE